MEDFPRELFLSLVRAKTLLGHLRPAENLSHAEYRLLTILKQHWAQENLRQPSEISREMGLPKPAVSKLLASLEEKGYIERYCDSRDHRIVYARLTANGEQDLAEVQQRYRNFYFRIFEGMGEEDSREMLRLIKVFFSRIEEEIQKGWPVSDEDAEKGNTP